MLERVWRKGTIILTLLVECKLVQPLWKTVWRFLKNLKIELPYDPATPFLGTCPEKMTTQIWKDTCTSMLIAMPRYGSNPSTHQQIFDLRICIHGILVSHKKNKILPFAATWMDLEMILLSKVSHTVKDKYMTSLIYGI